MSVDLGIDAVAASVGEDLEEVVRSVGILGSVERLANYVPYGRSAQSA
jgi:hypothetical protein